MKGLFDLTEIKRIDLYEQILDMEENLLELNNYEYAWSMGSEQDMLKILNDLLDDFNFYKVDYTHDYGVYWSGILPEFPFSEVDLSEEHLLNLIPQDFIYIEYDKGIYLSCKPTNSKSSLYRFFYKHREDSGGNFEYAINDMLRTISKWMIKKIKENPDRYGEWEQAIHPLCIKCGETFQAWESETTLDCPNCGHAFTRSEVEEYADY